MAASKSHSSAKSQDTLSDEILAPLKTYKYSSVDKSYTSRYILKHYWNGFVELLPLWLAPNMVTLLGFMFIIGNVVLLEIYVPDLIGPAPSWVYYSFAFGLWMYSTMDNVDGKQARRTGTSSGLGELFDHGIDSLNCTLASLMEAAAMGQGATKLGAFTVLAPCLAMFVSTWETYHTHTLYLGYFNGPTEGLIIGTLLMAAAGHYGPEIYSRPIAGWLGHPEIFGDSSSLDLWVLITLGAFFTAHLPACVYNVIHARRRNGLPVLPVFFEWSQIIIFTTSAFTWLYSPYSSLLSENRLVLFAVTMSFVFGRMTTKIILSHLTRQPFPRTTVLVIPLVGGAVLGNLPRLGFAMVSPDVELWYLRGYLAFAFTAYMHWARFVIGRITTFLDINCLTIKRDNKKADRASHSRVPNTGKVEATGKKTGVKMN